MQKFGKRKTYTPASASLACSSVAVSLNREETLGEHGLKTFSNSLEENLLSGREQMLKLSVGYLYSRGKPLVLYSFNGGEKSQFILQLKQEVSLRQIT